MGNNLTIDQINAPDFSGIGQLMASAGASFNNAFDAANSVLGKYQKGQEGKSDASYLNALGGIKNEQELTNFFLKNPLGQTNLSPEMRKTLLEMRNTVIGYDVDRATASNTNASADSTRAQTGRETVKFQDDMAALAANRLMAPIVTGAQTYGQTIGQPAISYANSGATRNDPLASDLEGIFNTVLPKTGLGFKVSSGGQETAAEIAANGEGSRTGATNHDHGGAGDGYFYDLKTGEKVDPKSDPRVWEAITNLTAAGAGGIGNGDGYMGEGMFHIGNTGGDRIWGADQHSGTASPELKAAWERGMAMRTGTATVTGGATPGPNGFSGGAQNGYLNDPRIQEAFRAIDANKYLTVEENMAQKQGVISSMATGQETISARDEKTQALLADQAIADAAQNSDLTTQGGIVSDVLGNTTLNPTTRVNTAGRADGLVGAGGSLNAVALPGVAPNQAAQAAADQATKNDAASTILSNVGRSADLAESMGSDPAKELMKSAGITEASGITSTVVERELDRYARESGLDKSEIAATLKVFDDQGIALEDVLKGKVDVSMVLDAAEKAYGATSKNKQTVELTTAAERASQRDSALAEIKSLQISLAKMKPGDPRQSAAQQRIQALTEGIAIGATPAEKIASQLQYVKPGSPEFLKIANELMAEVRKPGSGYSKTDIVNYSKQLGVP